MTWNYGVKDTNVTVHRLTFRVEIPFKLRPSDSEQSP